MPWAMETLGFQPVFAQTLLISHLCKRYWFHVFANVIGFTSLQTLLVSRLSKRYWFNVLANP